MDAAEDNDDHHFDATRELAWGAHDGRYRKGVDHKAREDVHENCWSRHLEEHYGVQADTVGPVRRRIVWEETSGNHLGAHGRFAVVSEGMLRLLTHEWRMRICL